MSIAMPAAEEYARSTESPSSKGRLRETSVAQSDRTVAIWIHLSPLVGFLLIGPLSAIIPIVLWLSRKDQSPYVDDHGRELTNALISYVLFTVLLSFTVIIPVILAIVAIVNVIRAAVAASNGEYFRYPVTIRFLS